MKTVGVSINPNNNEVQKIKERLKNNDGYCPSKKEKTLDNKCICKEFRQMEYGRCRCGLYIKHKN